MVFKSTKSSNVESVAVIGGGIAGLTCAQFLAKSGRYDPTVFDTGRLRPGGRCSSRMPGDEEAQDSSSDYTYLKSTIVDHAAQILTVPKGFPEFQKQADLWVEEGILTKYPQDTVCNIVDKNYSRNKKKAKEENKKMKDEGIALRPLNGKSAPTMYYGTKGMGSIPLAIQQSSQATINQDVWVAPSNGVRYQKESGKWKLQAKGETLGIFDNCVIAHNGKCADRIMSKTPAKSVHNLLRVNFSPRVPPWGGKRMTLNSIYSLTFALPINNNDDGISVLDKALPADEFVCGFVQNEPTLRFLSCQTRKYAQESDVQVWTVLSSATFAKKHKAPQEFLPADVVQNVTSMLLQGVERSLRLPKDSLEQSVLESRLQLWGAAVPVNVWENGEENGGDKNTQGFLHDSEFNVGVCGDWLLEASIAGAWESGRRLAEFMIHDLPDSKETVVGVQGAFKASQSAMKAGIGSLN